MWYFHYMYMVVSHVIRDSRPLGLRPSQLYHPSCLITQALVDVEVYCLWVGCPHLLVVPSQDKPQSPRNDDGAR